VQKNQFKLLVDKFLDGQISEEEKAQLFQIYQEYQDKDLIWDDELMGGQKQVQKKLLTDINNKIDSIETASQQRPIYNLNFFRYAAAAVVLAFLTMGGYMLLNKQPVKKVAQIQHQDIAPGGNRAILTLANGQQISLTGSKNGRIAVQGQTAINKTADGQVVYHAAVNQNLISAIAYNTISTPRGGQYWITLPDGSKVLLNAASSLKYPTSFTGKERKVELIGEAYFEVIHNKAQPFRVVAAGQTIEDIGTHFNINAYNDEPLIKTTLSEGRVKVSNEKHLAYLIPGQQAQIKGSDRNSKIEIKEVDIDEALAWKNGEFVFEKENIHSIMRKLSRWYDIEPEYASNVSEVGFGGSVSRNKNISEVLKVLELTQAVHFKIEGRRIKIMP
jgi:transmembrane sensor